MKAKPQISLLKKLDCFTFGKSKTPKAPISDTTVIIATTVTNIFAR